MKRTKSRNHQVHSHTASSQSFKTGNMLTHPQGMEVFVERSSQVQIEKQSQKDVQMLRKAPQFMHQQEQRRESGEISSQLENPESEIKIYKYETRLKYVNSKPVLFGEKVWLRGQQTSQLQDIDGEVMKCLEKYEKKDNAQIQQKEEQKIKRNRMMTEYETEEMLRQEKRHAERNDGTDKKRAFFRDQ